ncbi:MAG: hypothetical protein EU531_10755 [Promethearchaeota archaeon]|nr:MAG: hypothetical protein EU531_10755 [Candidatus Lokiarchaeota archaeon]
MQERIFYIKVIYKDIEKLRLWITQAELMSLLIELKENSDGIISFSKSVELQVIENNGGILTTRYYDKIRNITVDEIINISSIKQLVKVEI